MICRSRPTIIAFFEQSIQSHKILKSATVPSKSNWNWNDKLTRLQIQVHWKRESQRKSLLSRYLFQWALKIPFYFHFNNWIVKSSRIILYEKFPRSRCLHTHFRYWERNILYSRMLPLTDQYYFIKNFIKFFGQHSNSSTLPQSTDPTTTEKSKMSRKL